MKNTFKKISALVIVLVMVLSLSAVAFAANSELEENGEEGVAGDWTNPDVERLQDKTLNLQKEIIAYNPNGTTVHAPVITYTYTVTPAAITTGTTVTDEAGDHTANTPVTVFVKSGITTGLVITGTAAGTAGDITSAIGTLVFDNSSTWTTAADGDSNIYNIQLNFNGVTFPQAGVYRYQIAETISAASYAAVAMEDGTHNTVFLDVYVDGNLAIYGYVCMTENASVTPTTDTKINGFTAGTAEDNADKYYTYDLVVSKDVVNDTYGEGTIAFPYTIIFSNPESYTSTFTIGETAGTGSTGISPTAASAPTWSGVARVKDGGPITYTGIPAGVDVTIYETNIATGVTYSAETKINGTSVGTDNPVTDGTVPGSAAAQTTKAVYESTARTVDTTAITKIDDEQTFEIVNTLLLISPTGVVLRVAPYAAILGAGILLFAVSRKYSKKDEEVASVEA